MERGLETKQERNKQEKWQRLSQALRANLRKRKQQQREREQNLATSLDPNASESIPLTLALSPKGEREQKDLALSPKGEKEYKDLALSPKGGEGGVRGSLSTPTKEN